MQRAQSFNNTRGNNNFNFNPTSTSSGYNSEENNNSGNNNNNSSIIEDSITLTLADNAGVTIYVSQLLLSP